MKVIFVHGALVFDGAWWWNRMVEPLDALGLESRGVELPSCPSSVEDVGEAGDMYADADAVRSVLDEEDGPVVLVGHSYGGMVITDAAAGHANAGHLVYVTAVMPDRGEAMSSFGESDPAPWLDPSEADGTMGIKAESVPDAFMQDCDAEAVEGGLARLTRQRLEVFGQAPRGVGWQEKPTTYVLCAEDRATSPETQRRHARRAKRTVEVPTGHHPFLSNPGVLARVIAEAIS